MPVAGTISGARHALAGPTGWGQRRQPREGGNADDNSPDQREDDLPGFGGHRVLHDAMCRVITGDGGWRDESASNYEPQPEWLDEYEQEVAGKKRREADDSPDSDSAKPAGA
jgi:hypothetical protein